MVNGVRFSLKVYMFMLMFSVLVRCGWIWLI